ncbi:MAG TPA: hypothetical protein VLT56_13730, partial [Desulfobacterales bacterium]|nr:hypothetical protein [Desulfobacterales bacterium]
KTDQVSTRKNTPGQGVVIHKGAVYPKAKIHTGFANIGADASGLYGPFFIDLRRRPAGRTAVSRFFLRRPRECATLCHKADEELSVSTAVSWGSCTGA